MPPELAPFFAAAEASKLAEANAEAALASAEQALDTAKAQRKADVDALKAAVAQTYPE